MVPDDDQPAEGDRPVTGTDDPEQTPDRRVTHPDEAAAVSVSTASLFSPGPDSPSAVVVEAVAERADDEATGLDPLNEVVDPDALDALFQPRADGSHRDPGRVTFSYHGYHVSVRSDGVVAIRDPEDTQ